MSFDHAPCVVSSSGRSSVLNESPEPAANTCSPSGSSQNLQTPSASPPPSTAPNPFAAMAMMPASSTDLSEAESDAETVSTLRSSFDQQEPRHFSSHASSTRSSRAVPKSPKSPSRAHVQQPLDESECGKPLITKLGMIERTHSAPGTASLPSRFHAYTFKSCFSKLSQHCQSWKGHGCTACIPCLHLGVNPLSCDKRFLQFGRCDWDVG